MQNDYDYDVTLSFAGEQRAYVEQVAAALRLKGIRVFYDEYEKANLWGKDLYEHLDWVYQRAARFCVIFASADYAAKMWTSHERRSAQARAIDESVEYILPARFDDTEIPGLRKTIGHIDLRSTTPDELASHIEMKLGPSQRTRFLPPLMDRLFESLGVEGTPDERLAAQTATKFYFALDRMTVEERLLLLDVFWHGCPVALPDNIHIDVDLLRRVSGRPVTEIQQMLDGMRSLGITAEEYSGAEHPLDTVAVRWFDSGIYDDDPDQEDFSFERSTEVANAVLSLAVEGMCEAHGRAILSRLDLGNLSSATRRRHEDEPEAE